MDDDIANERGDLSRIHLGDRPLRNLDVLASRALRPLSSLEGRGQCSLESAKEHIQLLRRPIDIQHRVFGIRREEEREAVLVNLDVGVVMRVRARHVDARQIDSLMFGMCSPWMRT